MIVVRFSETGDEVADAVWLLLLLAVNRLSVEKKKEIHTFLLNVLHTHENKKFVEFFVVTEQLCKKCALSNN